MRNGMETGEPLTLPSLLSKLTTGRSSSPSDRQRIGSLSPEMISTFDDTWDDYHAADTTFCTSPIFYNASTSNIRGMSPMNDIKSAMDSYRPPSHLDGVRGDGECGDEHNFGRRCFFGDCPHGYLPHEWRKTCKNCKCPRDAHDVYHDEWITIRDSLGLTFAVDPIQRLTSSPRFRAVHSDYSWAPHNLSHDQVKQFFGDFDPQKIPLVGSPGEQYRDRQLSHQIPKQDLALAYCKHVQPENYHEYDKFIEKRNEVALDVGFTAIVSIPSTACGTCGNRVEVGELGVFAPKISEKACWHPHCFTCSDCNEHLVDLTYCKDETSNSLFCERHYAEKMKRRCAACDELIFSGVATSAMNKDWHAHHFCCWQCDETLGGQRYVLRDDHPYCVPCYEAAFANNCDQCHQQIGIGSKDLSYKDKHWHENCFYCFKCRISLVDRQFGSKADKIYCSPCYEAQFAARCDACGDVFKAGTKKMEYKTRQWHEKCFCCCVCKSPIGTKSFIPREQEIYCAGCYEEKFATRCVKCNKVITSGGVTYKNEPWHRDCFTCSHCNIQLAGQRFTSKDDKPYCADCYGELFAKRCFACSKPITGIGGTRFISFEERHWHNDCFICAMCKSSLVGRGFIADGDEIICPDCAKQKLM